MISERIAGRPPFAIDGGMNSAEPALGDADGDSRARNRAQGHVVECDGERAVIASRMDSDRQASADYWAVGQLITVRVGANRVVGLIHAVDTVDRAWQPNGENILHIRIELVGEIRTDGEGTIRFSTGITSYPHMGAVAHRIRAADLAAVYASADEGTVSIGHLTQDASIPALITVDKLLSRHFAVVGTTGVGKSTAVALLLRKIVAVRKDMRILLLDPHNEFTAAFPGDALTVNASTLDLPFWMFQLDEFVEVIFRGRPHIPEEVDALRDFIPMAKEQYAAEIAGGQALIRRRRRDDNATTADTPIPYRMIDLIKIIKDREGLLEGKADRPILRALRNRLEAIMNDSRFRFMFHSRNSGDSLEKTIRHIFRVPIDGKPICVFEMSGLPSEVVNSVVSVLARLAFELAVNSSGSIPTLLVCEEAHRYIPSDPNAGFWPTRTAIARIAKEGRKYGAYLAVVSQRPGELDPTIVSQCNTVFSMRLGNERDKQIIEQAISGAARSTISFLSALSNREAIAFGEAVPTPMRMMFETVSEQALPGSQIQELQERLRDGSEQASLLSVIRRMRKQDAPPIDYGEDFEHAPALSFVGDSDAEQGSGAQAGLPETRRAGDVQGTAILRAVNPSPAPGPAAERTAIPEPRRLVEPQKPAPRPFGREFEEQSRIARDRAGEDPIRESPSNSSDLIRSFRSGRG